MKSIRIHSFGGSQQLQLEEEPRPEPKRGEVLVAVREAGVNPVDWKIREGHFRAAAPSLPLTVGQDFAGEVVEGGDGVNDFEAGQRVFGFAHGAYAEYSTAAAHEIAALPGTVSFETAAALPTPGVTAFQLVTQAIQLQAGQTVLIHGAAGAVGALALQLAKYRGARVVATDLGPDVGYLRELGAERVIDTTQERFESGVGSVDAVIDLVGGDLLQRSYAVVRRGGVLATALGKVDDAEVARRGIHAVALVMRRNGADLAELAGLVEKGVLRPRIAQVLPLPEAQRAQDLSQNGKTHGKILLRVA